MTIRLLPLGAGQDVGRSCIVAHVGGRTVMLDCGMHMGYHDARRFPDFGRLEADTTRLTRAVDCVLIR